jgi:hypothetical protein
VKLLFYGWLYSVPFLLIVGLVRRHAGPAFATAAESAHYETVTSWYLWAAVLVNVTVPVLGMAVAWGVRRDPEWTGRFVRSLWWMALILLLQLVATAGSGSPPAEREPAPQVSRCIPVSGGRQCPGG